MYKLMKLRADDQAAQPQKREISSSYFPAESYRSLFFFFFHSASSVMYLYWSRELGMPSHLKQTAVK